MGIHIGQPEAKRIKLEPNATPPPGLGTAGRQYAFPPDSRSTFASLPTLAQAGQLAQVLAGLLPTHNPEYIYRRPVVTSRALRRRGDTGWTGKSKAKPTRRTKKRRKSAP